MKNYLLKIAVGLDILTCSIIFPKAKERETISGYLGINYPHDFLTLAINKVFYWLGFWPDPTHCSDVSKEEEQIFKIEDNN